MAEPLDTYSKILIATQTINHLGHVAVTVNNECRRMDSNMKEGSMKEFMMKERDENDKFFSEVASRLRDICEDLGNWCFNRDIMCEGYEGAMMKMNFDVLYEREEEFKEQEEE